jgi:hypothetical protein
MFLSAIASRPAPLPTQPPIQCVPGAPSPEIKRQGREADNSLPSSAEVKNGGAIPPLPIYIYGIVLNYIIKYTNNFTLPSRHLLTKKLNYYPSTTDMYLSILATIPTTKYNTTNPEETGNTYNLTHKTISTFYKLIHRYTLSSKQFSSDRNLFQYSNIFTRHIKYTCIILRSDACSWKVLNNNSNTNDILCAEYKTTRFSQMFPRSSK